MQAQARQPVLDQQQRRGPPSSDPPPAPARQPSSEPPSAKPTREEQRRWQRHAHDVDPTRQGSGGGRTSSPAARLPPPSSSLSSPAPTSIYPPVATPSVDASPTPRAGAGYRLGLRPGAAQGSSAAAGGAGELDSGAEAGEGGGARFGGSGGVGGARGGPGGDGAGLSYARRVALLRKPMLTAADKTALDPEERARIYEELRQQPRGPTDRPPLRVFCYGIDDVRLYKALQGAGALGRLLVVPGVAAADAVLALRIKRTGRQLSLVELTNAARNAAKPLLVLRALSAERIAEALRQLTGEALGPLPARQAQEQRRRELRQQDGGDVKYLPALGGPGDGSGAAEALRWLSGGRPLPECLAARLPAAPPPSLLQALDSADPFDPYSDAGSRSAVAAAEEAAAPGRPRRGARGAGGGPAVRGLPRPHMRGSRAARIALAREAARRRAEAAGQVDW